MGIIATASFILATQTASGGKVQTLPTSDMSRLDEIWDHVDNRLVTQADTWFDLGEFPVCVSLLRVQSAYSPDDYDVTTSLGWMLENIEQVEDARTVYLDFSNRHPNDGNAVFALGFSYSNAKDYDNAIKYLEPSLQKNASPNSYRVLAKAYERKGMLKDAIRVWELQLKKYPGEGPAIANIKRVKAKLAAGGK